MILVVDTSVLIAVITNEKSKTTLIKITKGEELIAPSSLHWEIGNAFSALFKRNKLDYELAQKALEFYLRIPMRLVDVDLANSLKIAEKYNIYAYDAYFLECARNFNSPLLTLDNRLGNVAKQMNIILKKV